MSALPIQSTVEQLLSAGLSLSLTPERGLRVVPASGITTELRELIRSSKAALVDYLHRRHLSESQRGMVASKLANITHGGNRKDQDANLHFEVSRSDAADMLNVSTRTVAAAANDTIEPFTEPPGYEGTGWRLAGADGLSPATLAKFRAASLALDAYQSANTLQLQGTSR